MSEVEISLESDYEAALSSYLSQPSEEALMRAANIGRLALGAGVSALELVVLHHRYLSAALELRLAELDRSHAVDSAGLFLSEALSPFEMTHRGFREVTEAITRIVQFAEVVVHELRTPLTGMMSSIGMLSEVLTLEPSSTSGRLLANVERSTEILKARTDDLLDIVGFQSGNFSLKPEQIEPAGLLAEIVGRLQPELIAAGMELRLECEERLPLLQADPARLEQVVANLVHNAVKYAADGKIVDVRARSSERGSLILEVQDYGRGVALWDRMKIFQPNYRGANATSSGLPGLGLGLALCSVLVEQHGGTISLESEEGTGSLFRIELPLARVPLAGKEGARAKQGAHHESLGNRGRRRGR